MEIRKGWTALSDNEISTLMQHLLTAHRGDLEFRLKLDVLMTWSDGGSIFKVCRYMFGGDKVSIGHSIRAFRGTKRLPIGGRASMADYVGHVSVAKRDIVGISHRAAGKPLTILCLHLTEARSSRMSYEVKCALIDKMVEVTLDEEFPRGPVNFEFREENV